MYLKLIFITSLLVQLGFSSQSIRDTVTEPTISECAAKGGECDESKGRPVCGTDNQTYPTRCHLIRAQCAGHQVSIKHRGTCKDACVISRAYAITHRSSFTPRCRADGSYAPVQCATEAGCWCVNGQGKPILNTTVRTGKPICAGKFNIRRSPPRGNINLDDRNRRMCSKGDRIAFNTNLIKMFYTEYLRYHSNQQIPTMINDKIILDWKFSNLDINNNYMLDKIEYRELKRIVKKAVKPKRCARSFGKYCDNDLDDRLSRQEWGLCLSKDGVNLTSSTSHVTHPGSSNHKQNMNNNKNGRDGRSKFDNFDDDSFDDDDYDDLADTIISFGGVPVNAPDTRVKPVFLLKGKTTLELSGESDAVLPESEGESDCLADRAQAIDEQKSGTQALYVPECTPDGRYQRVQCYRSTGYCWCVHEDTGKNIPGTSTKDVPPQCDSIAPLSRPMKGCSEEKKNEFLRELKIFLKAQFISTSNSGVEPTKWKTEDEKIATLSFVILDKNKNKLWERREWKTFRDSIATIKPLRKCGKKMPRYCDVNSDRKITLSEWMNCLQIQRVPTEYRNLNESRTTNSTKLRGKNPLESYLKSD